MNMRIRLFLFALATASVLLASCSMPQVSTDNAALPGPADQPPPPSAPSLVVDSTRGLTVYVTETGERIDVVNEEPDGSLAVCAEPFALAPVPEESEAARHLGPTIRGVVIGRRHDGAPGIWVIYHDGSVTGAEADEGGNPTSTLPSCKDRDGVLTGRRGWTYHLRGWATDGTMTIVTGYAEHTQGFQHGPLSVEPGTTIGVYWRIWRKAPSAHVMVSPARIIGTLDPDRPWPPRHRWPRWMDWHARLRFLDLKLFLQGWYDTYLTMVDEKATSWDEARQLFVVGGLDQDDQPADASIDRKGTVAITPRDTSEKPDLEVSTIVVADSSVNVQEEWTLGASVTNTGDTDAPGVTVRFISSSDATLDENDFTIGNVVTKPVLVGATEPVTWSNKYSLTEPGTRWFFAVVDPGNAVAESDETDNVKSAAVLVRYPAIAIDTYRPIDPELGGFVSTNTYVTLYGPRGTLADAIDEEDGGGLFSRFARIVYDHPERGLEPGTYYVQVRGGYTDSAGPYAIRVLTDLAKVDTYTSAEDYFTAVAPEAETSATEPDDATSDGKPVKLNFLAIGGRMNRYLAVGDVDWVTITLP
jgi:hypothetical protein